VTTNQGKEPNEHSFPDPRPVRRWSVRRGRLHVVGGAVIFLALALAPIAAAGIVYAVGIE
jgi:hypothetical protein